MAILKPIVNSFTPVDASRNFTINFTVSSSSDQVFGNRVIIKNNLDNTIVYDNTVTTFLLQHDIPANLLTNGNTYNIIISVFNISNTYSPFSDGTIFKCLSTPVIGISNLNNNDIISNSNFTAIGSYSQAESEPLSSYIFYLYDSNNNLLQSSPEQFYAPSNTIEYTFSGFENNENYGIKLETITQSGIHNITSIIPFLVQYIAPQFSGNLDLSNVPDEGAIKVTASVIQILGQIGTGTISYQDDDYINLNNGMVYFDNNNGMSPFSNFTLRLWVKGLIKDKIFLTLASPQGTITLQYSSEYNAILAEKSVTGHKYMIFGNVMEIVLDNLMYIELKQINNYLDLAYEVVNTPTVANTARFFVNSKAIVSNSADTYYASYPNPPLGGVFNNINITTGELSSGIIDTPATCWSLINLLKIYAETSNSVILDRAKLIGNYLVNHIIDASFYGTNFRVMPNQYNYNVGSGSWVASTDTIHVRTQYHTLWALLELYKVTNDITYSNACGDLMKTIGNAYNNIKTRATTGAEISSFMVGAIYNTINTDGATPTPAMTFSWNIFNNTTADVLSKAISLYIELIGNTQIADWQGTLFVPQSIIDDYKVYIQYIYNNQGLTMSGTGLPYEFMQYNFDDPLVNGVNVPICKNWDWINNVWGDVWFVNDLEMWLLIGLANLGLADIITEYRSKFLSLKISDYTDRILFRDRYNFNGSALVDDTSTSICATGLLYNLDNILGIVNNNLHLLMANTLYMYQIKSANKNIDGSYQWDVLDASALIEVKATAEIIYSPYKVGA